MSIWCGGEGGKGESVCMEVQHVCVCVRACVCVCVCVMKNERGL